MNDYQVKLFNDLISLCEYEAFYNQDVEMAGVKYKIFNYRMASYTEFLRPGGIECRGTMFEVDVNDNPVRLASIAFEKFWNLNECPATMDLDLTTVVEIADKADGSLITSYMHGKDLMLKSKGSVASDQAIDSMGWITLPENNDFMNEVIAAERLGYTVQFEWCAPFNRIVLGYDTPELKVLGVRSRNDGSYVDFKDVDIYIFPEIMKHWTHLVPTEDPVEFVSRIPDMTGVEGYVLRLESGQRVKVKCAWYLALHHTKDSINSPRRLFEAVLEEATDDMRSLFFEDEMAIKLIDEMEAFVEEKYNHMVDIVERFYERNKHLNRKEYAILGQKEIPKMYFSLAMNKYIDREFSYKDFLKSKWKEMGLRDMDEKDPDEFGTKVHVDLESVPRAIIEVTK